MQLSPRVSFIRTQTRLYSSRKRFVKVDAFSKSKNGNAESFNQEKPALLQNQFSGIPAIVRWFKPSESGAAFDELNEDYLEEYGETVVPLELTRSDSGSPNSFHRASFERMQAPFDLLLSHMSPPSDPYTRLYLAQCPLDDLPSELQADLPIPSLISRIGRGHVYGSSLWMGRPPTMTPLHRDPNPNIFVQLAGKKVVRLMRPDAGKLLYERLSVGLGHANMRGEEMMAGEEYDRFEDAVWDDDHALYEDVAGWEATLHSADGLFIPLGWWHSVRGVGKGVNASVNWWFR